MIYTYIKLENYAGIYNGMFLNEIEIDFTKCKSKIIRIIGDNGSGKSTLLNAITPLPDDNINFIPDKTASKTIGILDEMTGIKYLINFIHPIINGERGTSKGYFTKLNPDGTSEEMNPTGKISSCKELIYDEFDLDSNFISLTKMNTTDCGLARKTPSERKRYVNSIINDTQVYTNMYKKISKKSNYFKDTLKRITSKIESLGNIENLSLSLQQTIETINKSEQLIQKLSDEISMAKSKKLLLDPDGSLEKEFNSNTAMYNELLLSLKSLNISIDDLRNPDELKNELDSYKYKIEDNNKKISEYNTELEVLISKRETDTTRLQEKQAKLDSFSYQSYSDIEKELNNSIALMEVYKEQVLSLGIDLNNMITKDEYMSAYSAIQNIQQAVSNYYDNNSDITLEEINIAFEYIKDGFDIEKEIINIDRNIKLYTEDLSNLDNKISSLESKLEILKILDNRPNECKIDSCAFISNALSVLKEDPIKQIEILNTKRQVIIEKINSTTEIKISLERSKVISKFIETVFMFINYSKNTLSKLGLNDLLKDEYQFMIDIYNHKSYDYITFMHNAVVDANCIDLYNQYRKNVEVYSSELKLYKEKESLLLEIQSDINILNNNINECLSKVVSMNEEIDRLNNENISLQNLLESKNKEFVLCDSMFNVINRRNQLIQKYSEIEECNKIINETESKKTNASNYLESQKDKQNSLAFDIKMINQYLKEIQEIKNESFLIEIIKKYCNPSQGGIQNAFLAIYMEDVIVDCNKILSTLFNGTLMLQKFIINENEFRLPVAVENGIAHDDIASLSTGQTALVSMVLSFALVNKSSSKLNVLTSDELDGSLDTSNRRHFLITLKTTMDKYNCNQAIMISHNAELSNDECDIILLKNENGDGNVINGNIIWNYYK